jgi:hypothetical protein
MLNNLPPTTADVLQIHLVANNDLGEYLPVIRSKYTTSN